MRERSQRAGAPFTRTRATVAVKPCRKYSPPTGPISPAAKKPAAGAPRSASATRLGVVVGARRTSPRPRPLQANTSAPAGGGRRARRMRTRERLAQVAVGARRRRGRAAARPGRDARRRRPPPARCPGRRPPARARGSRPARSRACSASTTIPTSSPPCDERAGPRRAAPRSSRAASRAPACRPARRSRCPRPAVIVSSGPIGAAPCETHGSSSTPSSRTPTAPSVDDLVAEEQRGLVVGRPRRRRARRSAARRAPLGEEAQHRRRSGTSPGRRAGSRRRRPSRSAMPVSAPVPSSSSSTIAWNVGRAAVAERRRPHRHRRAVLELAPRADHAAGAAADQLRRAQRLVHGLEHRLRRRQVRPGGEHDRRSQRSPSRPRAAAAPPRAPPRAGRARWRGRCRCGRAWLEILPDTARGAVHTGACRRTVVALFGPDRRRQDRGRRSRSPRACARRGEDPVAVSADALQVYRGPRDAHRRRDAQPSRRSWSTGCSRSCRRRDLQRRRATPSSRTQRSTALLAAGRRPIVVGGTGLYLRAALAELDLRPPPARVRERWAAALERPGRARAARRAARRAPRAAAAIGPTDRQRIVRALELLDAGELPPPRRAAQLWTDETRHPTLLAGLTMEREALYARIDARIDAMLAAGAREEVRRAHARRRLGDRTQGARLPGAAAPATSRRCGAAPATTRAASSRGCASCRRAAVDVTDRDGGRRRRRPARRPSRAGGMIRPCASRSGRHSATTI